MCGLYLFAPLEGVAQKFTVFRKSLSCTIFQRAFFVGALSGKTKNPTGSEKYERLYASVFLCRGSTKWKRQAPASPTNAR